MTEDERESGRREGQQAAMLKEHSRRVLQLEERVAELHANQTRVDTKQKVLWQAIAAVAAVVGAGAFKLWAGI